MCGVFSTLGLFSVIFGSDFIEEPVCSRTKCRVQEMDLCPRESGLNDKRSDILLDLSALL